MISDAEKLLQLTDKARSPFHCIKEAKSQLSEAGFLELSLGEEWKLSENSAYYVDCYGSSLVAFRIHSVKDPREGFRLSAAHTDWPCLRIKPNPECTEGKYLKLNVETYGGLILNTWLDRPLSIAGRVVLKGSSPFTPKICLVDFDRVLLTIPNVAIHQNRKVNEGIELNRQTDMLPLLGMIEDGLNQDHFFLELLAKELHCSREEILDFELSVYNRDPGQVFGRNGEFISSPRLDDLTSVQACLTGIIEGKRTNGINVAALFDHEEIGNRTKEGAASVLLSRILEKIYESLGISRKEYVDACFNSLLLSVDVGHGIHPNKTGVYDITNQIYLNEGFVLKMAAAQSYTTDSAGIAVVEGLCQKYEIPYKKFVNRSDLRGGGTLGSVASTLLPAMAVDVGVPLLAMHSAREMMGAKDQKALTDLLRAFYKEEL